MPETQFPFTDLTDPTQLYLLNIVLEDLQDRQDYLEATGVIRAWVSFDGTTAPPTIRSSFNVSSIGDTGTGSYQVVWTNDFADANYAVIATCVEASGTPEGRFVNVWSTSAPLTTSATVNVFDGSASTSAVDEDLVFVIAIGIGTG